MPERVPRSWAVLDDAIGPCRGPLADLLGMSRDTVDLWCLPPPSFAAGERENRGRTNPIDRMTAIVRRCPNGLVAVQFVAEQVGYRLVPLVDTPHGDELFAARPSAILADVRSICTELNRRKPKFSAAKVAALHAKARDGLAALVAAELERRAAQ